MKKRGAACRGRRPFHHKEKLMKRGHKKKISLVSYLFILPALILNLMFFVFPFLQSLLMSFYDWPVLGEKTFVFLDNYINATLSDVSQYLTPYLQ